MRIKRFKSREFVLLWSIILLYFFQFSLAQTSYWSTRLITNTVLSENITSASISGTFLTSSQSSICQPICKEIGTEREGWYDSCTGKLIKLEKCSNCKIQCLGNKGWHSICYEGNRIKTVKLVKKEDCSKKLCMWCGEECVPYSSERVCPLVSPPKNYECKYLVDSFTYNGRCIKVPKANVEVSTDKTFYQYGEPVRITVKNVGEAPVKILHNYYDYFSIDVRYSTSNESGVAEIYPIDCSYLRSYKSPIILYPGEKTEFTWDWTICRDPGINPKDIEGYSVEVEYEPLYAEYLECKEGGTICTQEESYAYFSLKECFSNSDCRWCEDKCISKDEVCTLTVQEKPENCECKCIEGKCVSICSESSYKEKEISKEEKTEECRRLYLKLKELRKKGSQSSEIKSILKEIKKKCIKSTRMITLPALKLDLNSIDCNGNTGEISFILRLLGTKENAKGIKLLLKDSSGNVFEAENKELVISPGSNYISLNLSTYGILPRGEIEYISVKTIEPHIYVEYSKDVFGFIGSCYYTGGVSSGEAAPIPKETSQSEESYEMRQEIDSSKILEKLISLETLKIKIESIRDKIKLIADYYLSVGNEEKYNCWSSVIIYFDKIISALENAKDCLKNYDLECFKEKVNQAKELIKEIVDKLLECA